MDTGEVIGVVFVSAAVGLLSMILLKDVLSDSLLNQMINIFEYIGDQFYYQLYPLTNPELMSSQENTYNSMHAAFNMIRFLVGFSPTFGFGIWLVNR